MAKHRGDGLRNIGDGAAIGAHEMGMGVLTQVVERGTAAGMHVLQNVELVETLQNPVHRRWGDAGRSPLDLIDQIIGGEMAIGFGEDRHDQSCGQRRAPTRNLDAFEDSLRDTSTHVRPSVNRCRRTPVAANTTVNNPAPTSTMLGPDWMSSW